MQPLEDYVLSHLSIVSGDSGTKAAVMTAKTLGAGATSEEILARVISSLEDDKAEDVVTIDLRGRSSIGDYMVICSGRSTRQVSAIAENLSDHLKQDYGRICKVEGKDQGDWVLLDSSDVIVHIFRPEVREFYQLEKMWMSSGMESLSTDAEL